MRRFFRYHARHVVGLKEQSETHSPTRDQSSSQFQLGKKCTASPRYRTRKNIWPQPKLLMNYAGIRHFKEIRADRPAEDKINFFRGHPCILQRLHGLRREGGEHISMVKQRRAPNLHICPPEPGEGPGAVPTRRGMTSSAEKPLPCPCPCPCPSPIHTAHVAAGDDGRVRFCYR